MLIIYFLSDITLGIIDPENILTTYFRHFCKFLIIHQTFALSRINHQLQFQFLLKKLKLIYDILLNHKNNYQFKIRTPLVNRHGRRSNAH